MKIILFFIVPLIFCFINAFLISETGRASDTGTKESFSSYISARYKLGSYGPLKAFCVLRKEQILFEMMTQQTSPQPVESITKSIAALVIGIAIKRGDLKSINQNVLDFFPEYKNKVKKEWKSVTLENLLTMRSGIEWEEDKRPEFLNPTFQMYAAENMYDYIFSKEINYKKQFNYSSSNAALLSAIIFKATGKTFAEYADEVLFKPLEITNYKWSNYKNGNTNTSGGLSLTLNNLAKLGMLYLQNGKWKEKHIVSADWISNSFQNYSEIKGYLDVNAYGYMWWINDSYQMKSGKQIKIFSACGYNNNHLILIPECNLLIVTMGDCTSQPEKYLNLVEDILSGITSNPLNDDISKIE